MDRAHFVFRDIQLKTAVKAFDGIRKERVVSI